MKKVLLLAAALMLVAGQSPASIVGTKHDLSDAGPGTATGYDEVCIFCHTPHRAIDQTNAPLWNRTDTDTITIARYYNSATLESASLQTAVSAKVLASDAKLCLSCHDGASLTKDLRNPSTLESGVQPDWTGFTMSDDANLDFGHAAAGVDLHDDHPIGMNYDTVQAADGELTASTTTAGKKFVDTLPLYTADGVMWCSSCHDVHNNTNIPFLAKSNVSSGLCLTCHNK